MLIVVNPCDLTELPKACTGRSQDVDYVLLAGAVFGLGVAVHLGRLVRTGSETLAFGALPTLLAATISPAGTVVFV